MGQESPFTGKLMSPPNILYSAFLMLAGMICFIAGIIVSQRRPFPPGSIPLMVLLFALSWWDSSYSLFWAGTPGPTPFFWLDITYLGTVIVPAALLIFAMEISDLGSWLKRPFLISLAVEPLLVTILLWTDPLHGLFFAGKRLENSAMILDGGPVFWANLIYSYLVLLIGFILLIRRFIQTAGIHRQQIGVILAGLSITWLNSIIFVIGLNPIPGADNTPFSFTIAGLAFTYAILRYRFLDILPIARHLLIEGMSDGVIVIDAQNRLADLNPVAEQVLGGEAKLILGTPVREVFSRWPDLVAKFHDVMSIRTEVRTERAYLDVRISPLHDQRQNFLGRLVVWRDISELKLVQMELVKLAQKDPLTHVYNRRHFLELARIEYERFKRTHKPISLAILDLDHFKRINDTYGHQVGDETLVRFTKICTSNIRAIDLFARFGGEEFVLLLPETNMQQAYKSLQRLQAALRREFDSDEEPKHLTASFGLATLSDPHDTLDMLIQKADKALYMAKDNGRDQIVSLP
ncbi:MAG: hypothetical protein C3F07_17505 [Anaerolineales bacterium]|nr:MAG: hypothetical protein C3F07_17505 [Anaerolineales bacterium]